MRVQLFVEMSAVVTRAADQGMLSECLPDSLAAHPRQCHRRAVQDVGPLVERSVSALSRILHEDDVRVILNSSVSG